MKQLLKLPVVQVVKYRRKSMYGKINVMLRAETEFKFHKMVIVSEFYMDVNRRLRTTKISLKL